MQEEQQPLEPPLDPDFVDDFAEPQETAPARVRARRPSLFWPLLLIGAGVVLLLYQLGWFGWLGSLFWPILIIGVGFYLLSRRNT